MPNPAVAFLTKSINANVGVVVTHPTICFETMDLNFSVVRKKNSELMEKKIQDSLKFNYVIDPCNWVCKKKYKC